MDTAATLALLLNRMIDGAASRPDHETTPAILDEASHSGERHLAPLAAMSDGEGRRMAAGRVKTDDLARSTRFSPVRISP